MLVRPPVGARAARQLGMSLVELLVGVAIGLFIVAGAATVVATQLADTRRLTLEAQVQQDLRATSDFIARLARRGGYTSAAASTVWTPGAGAASLNANAGVTVSAANDSVSFYLTNPTSAYYQFFWDHGSPGVVWLRTPTLTSTAQALTDSTSMSVTGFSVQLAPVTTVQPVQMSCAALCADLTQTCWPTLQPRELVISITGTSQSDTNVVRTIQSTVRIRNDQITNNNVQPPYSVATPGPLCPT